MGTFPRAMAALDLSDMDQAMLAYFGRLAPLLGVKKAYFLHVVPDFSAPDKADIEFQKLFDPDSPIDEKVRERLESIVKESLGGQNHLDVAVEVVEGKPYERLIHWSEVKNVDLLLVGHKDRSEGSGITPKRVARKADCSVLFVPPSPPEKIRKLLVPIDFSDNALRALQTAIAWARNLDDAVVQVLYVVDMPPGDYYIKPYNKKGYRALLLESAQRTYRDYAEKHGFRDQLGTEPVFIPNDYSSVAAHIDEWIKENGADMVVIGAQGHTPFENLIYGSVTERFVERCTESPILVIR